jgi:thiamine pyrophosphate-dependent acetolactate synthase large subunit-like protein
MRRRELKATSVAEYIVARLAAEGISHCFGVAGDYVFPICDAVDSSAKVKWIGCANELNAAYAADGFARIRGAAMLATTYGVGELSALNGVMGAKAEQSLVFHIVGMPSYQHQRLGKDPMAGRSIRDIRSIGIPRASTDETAIVRESPAGATQAIFCRRRHQPRRPPLAKIRPGSPGCNLGDRRVRSLRRSR